MLQKSKLTIRKVIGYILIVFGLMGLILPILPGWWVILIGLEILGWRLVIHKEQPWWKKLSLRRKKESLLDKVIE